jgi:hypothetical protein
MIKFFSVISAEHVPRAELSVTEQRIPASCFRRNDKQLKTIMIRIWFCLARKLLSGKNLRQKNSVQFLSECKNDAK